jgi:hypothetical protein
MTTLYKIEELIKCCDRYPLYHKANGLRWVACPTCNNRSQAYQTAGLSANKGWNEKRKRQLKIENLYNGKPHWYAKDKA